MGGTINVEVGPPRLVIPYVQHRTNADAGDNRLWPETRAIGEAMGATFVDLTGDDQGYFALLERLWADGQGFLLLEEDVAPSVEVLKEMWACGEEWCSGWFYSYRGEIRSGDSKPRRPERYRTSWTLALHKFSTALLARTPQAMQMAGGGGQRHWNQLDMNLVHPDGVLCGASYRARPHLHGPIDQPKWRPAWVSLIGEDEWVEPEPSALVPASDQRDNHGAPFMVRIRKANDECR